MPRPAPGAGDRRDRLHPEYADQIRALRAAAYSVLGTDGFGRSDTRAMLRRFFEVDRHYVALTALVALADDGTIDRGG